MIQIGRVSQTDDILKLKVTLFPDATYYRPIKSKGKTVVNATVCKNIEFITQLPMHSTSSNIGKIAGATL